MTAPRRILLATFAATFVVAGTGACAPPAAVRPRLTAVSPESVQLIRGNVIEIALTGTGFDTTHAAPQNTVRVGALVLTGVPSSAGGTSIRIVLPDAIPSGGEAPPAPWMPGSYAVTVSTKAGTSDTLSLAIAASGMRP